MRKYQEIDEKNEKSPDKKGKFGEGKQDAFFTLFQKKADAAYAAGVRRGGRSLRRRARGAPCLAGLADLGSHDQSS